MTRKFCAVDAEGDAGDKGLLGVALFSDERQEYHTEHEAIRDALLWHARKGYTFISHNMEYDLPVVWWQLGLTARCISYNRAFNHGEWKYSAGRRPAMLWDSLNLAAGVGLEELGPAIGLPKYSRPQVLRGVDPNRYEWRCAAHDRGECVACYCLRDAQIVWTYVQYMCFAVQSWGATLQRRVGSTGLDIWKALDHPGPLRLHDRRAAYLGRRAYFGGRVECFRLGHFAPLYCADVQSMYPSVMLEARFPDPAHMVTIDAPAVDAVPWELEGAAHCEVIVPRSHVPPLPIQHNGERVFGYGKQRGYWTFHELRYAQSLGAQVCRVYRAAWSLHSLSPFTWFVSTLWAAREEYQKTNDPRHAVVKALLNETYGRFGLSEQLSEEVIQPCPEHASWKEHRAHRHFGAYGQLMCGATAPKYFDRQWSNELWAAQITAAARVKLHHYLLMQGDALVYCDTDSVFSMAPIIGTSDGLGQLHAETAYERGRIVGPKMYRLEPLYGAAITKAKGVPRELAEQFLKGEQVYFDRPLSPHQMYQGKGQAGAWVVLSRERRLVPYRRQPVHPEELETAAGQSLTLPPMIG